jgi:hypothetical protein
MSTPPVDSSSDAAAGSVIGERYRLDACLSRSAQGSLWRGSVMLAA